jgi:hypothetical protein
MTPPQTSRASSPEPNGEHELRPATLSDSASAHSTGGTPSSEGRHPTSSEHAAALITALNTLAEKMSLIGYGAEHLQCSETDAIADVLVLTGHVEAATLLRDGHAAGDSDPEDAHHARFHEMHEHTAMQMFNCCGPDEYDQLTDRIKEER